MQKQQRDAETILLTECLVSIEKYTTISDVVFSDGFTLVGGSDVRRVIESEEVKDSINVLYDDVFAGLKKFMWIKKDNLKLTYSGQENWGVEDYNKEIKDKNESWFD